MNKYEEYLDMKEFFDAVLSGSNYAIKEYYRKKISRIKNIYALNLEILF